MSVLILVVVSGKYARIPHGFLGKLRPSAAFLSIVFAIFLIATSPRNVDEHRGQFFFDSNILPVDAIDFLVGEKLPQPIFNPFYWGGYISWRAYPEYKVFIDSRLLDPSLSAEEVYAEQNGTIKTLLHKYGINTAIYFPIDNGQVKWIVLGLLKDDEWDLVYFDRKAAIFVKAGNALSIPFINKQHLYDFLILYAQLQIRDRPFSSDGYDNLSAIYHAMGKEREAQEVYGLGRQLTGEKAR